MRGVWRQALSLPWPLILWGGQQRFRDPCVPGAVVVGVATQHRSHSVRPCGQSLRALGLAEGCPRGGGAFCRCEGRSSSRAPPPPAAFSLGGLSGSLTCRGRGCAGVGAEHCPFGMYALWGLRAAGLAGAVPRGGLACHRPEGRLVSGAVPPPAARPLGRAAGYLRPVCPGCGWCGHGDRAPVPHTVPLRAVVGPCGGGGGASPRGVPFAVMGASEIRPSLSSGCPPSWPAVSVRYPRAMDAGSAGVGAQHCPSGLHALWGLRAAEVVGGCPRGGDGLPLL